MSRADRRGDYFSHSRFAKDIIGGRKLCKQIILLHELRVLVDHYVYNLGIIEISGGELPELIGTRRVYIELNAEKFERALNSAEQILNSLEDTSEIPLGGRRRGPQRTREGVSGATLPRKVTMFVTFSLRRVRVPVVAVKEFLMMARWADPEEGASRGAK